MNGKKIITKCVICGSDFECWDTQLNKPCSTACMDVIRLERNKIPSKYGLKKCAECDAEFYPQTSKTKYCSYTCANNVKHRAALEIKEEKDRADFYIFQRDQFKCSYCGKSPIEDNVRLIVEHIFPRAYGGTNSFYNVTTSCFKCNSEKFGNIIPFNIYKRLIKRNIRLNKWISIKKQKEIRKLLEKYYPAEREYLNMIDIYKWVKSKY